MLGIPVTLDLLQKRTAKLAERRRFFRKSGGFAVGMAGGAVLAACGGRAVPFKDAVVAQYAREIANDEADHLRVFRVALGSAAVAQRAIDVSADVDGAFSSAARLAGLIKAGEAFDPYASDEAFLFGAFIFEDVGVRAAGARS